VGEHNYKSKSHWYVFLKKRPKIFSEKFEEEEREKQRYARFLIVFVGILEEYLYYLVANISEAISTANLNLKEAEISYTFGNIQGCSVNWYFPNLFLAFFLFFFR
jgi:hypothetical protein